MTPNSNMILFVVSIGATSDLSGIRPGFFELTKSNSRCGGCPGGGWPNGCPGSGRCPFGQEVVRRHSSAVRSPYSNSRPPRFSPASTKHNENMIPLGSNPKRGCICTAGRRALPVETDTRIAEKVLKKRSFTSKTYRVNSSPFCTPTWHADSPLISPNSETFHEKVEPIRLEARVITGQHVIEVDVAMHEAVECEWSSTDITCARDEPHRLRISPVYITLHLPIKVC
jgi:hypothetical protein